MKRILAALLVLMLVGMLLASCGGPSPVEDFTFELNEDGASYTITKYVGEGGNVSIPPEYNGLPVVGIKDIGSSKIEKLHIPDSVTTLASNFFMCSDSALVEITVDEGNPAYFSVNNCLVEKESKTLVRGCVNSVIPGDGSIVAIGENAFYGESSLTEIVFPEGITSIGKYALANCGELTSISIPTSLTDFPVNVIGDRNAGSPKLSFTVYENCKYLGNGENLYVVVVKTADTNLSVANIHQDTKVIAAGAFSDCESLTTVNFASGIVEIGRGAFSGCTSLETLNNFPGAVTEISQGCFEETNLVNFTVPSQIKVICENAFKNADLEGLCLSEGVQIIEDGAFSYAKLPTGFTIPNTVVSIGTFCFRGTDFSGATLVIPDSVTSIGRGALTESYNLGVLTIGAGITEIPQSFADNSRDLTMVTIGENVKKICQYAFYNTKLTAVELYSSLKEVEDKVFSNALMTFVYNGTVEEFNAITNIKNMINPYGFTTKDHAKVVCTDGEVLLRKP